MKARRSRFTPLLVTIAAALVLGATWWFSVAPEGDAPPRKTEVPRREGVVSTGSAPEQKTRGKTQPAASTASAAAKPDRMLDELRSKLEVPGVVPGEALLTFSSEEARDDFISRAGRSGLEILATIPQLNTARVGYGRLDDLRDAIASSGGEYPRVEGNLWLSIPGSSPQPDPTNEGGRAPFGSALMNALNAGGDRTRWGEGVTVAVLDTGILAHPTFAQGQVTHLDLVGDGKSFHSHGTSVASMIGGQNPQAPGLAPASQIIDVRVANADGISVGSTLAEGIITATDRGAKVINISLGGYGDSAIVGQAVTYALQRGTVVVAAAGNDAYAQLAVPAAYEGVISVGSVDANNRQAFFSNAGAGLDMAAPGVGVVSAWETDKVALVSGTSQSSALVAAAAASYLSWGVPPGQVGARLKADARPAFNASGVATGVGILTLKPPGGR